MATLLILALFVVPPPPAVGETVEGELVRAIDGDTLDMSVPGRNLRVRLAEIDAPEKDQPYGTASRLHLQAACEHERLRLTVTQSNERFGRVVGHIYVLERGQRPRWINHEQVKLGLAWWAIDWSNDAKLARAEREAWIDQKGLWKDSRPTPPWVWRKKD